VNGLDRLKVARLAAVRRAAIRARSYCLVGFYACLVSAADLVWMAVWRIVALRQIVRPSLYAIAALGLIWFGCHLLKKSRAFAREAAQSLPDSPPDNPDFTNLGDGSQIARDLENMK
jgi:hypothetical protein